MKIFQKTLIASAIFLFSGSLFASCPQVGGYTVTAHNANSTKCVYAANSANFAASHNAKLCKKDFILTDPDYKVINCKYGHQVHKCVCGVAKK